MEKRVVFIIWTERLNEQRGGVHRIILLLLKYLPAAGFEVHYLYTLDNYSTFLVYDDNVSGEIRIKCNQLKEYLIRNNCDIILGQDGALSTKLTQIVSEMSLQNVKFVNEYHSSLLHIMHKLNRDFLCFEFVNNNSVKHKIGIIIKYIFYPIWKYRIWKKISESFRYNFLNCDLTLLLTKKEEPIVQSIMPKGIKAKCVAIPNPLSWEKIEDDKVLLNKQNEVLVVSRIYNPEKRIDQVLKIWGELQKRKITQGWILRIVGDGIHKELLMRMADQMKLHGIIWEGWREPKPFYQSASIFMMTSACEGWGLTLTESMQTGVVPLAFDTYPALDDIITDGYNGFILKPNDIKGYADKMQSLMLNQLFREEIARNALASCKRFATNRVMNMWSEMLHSI